MMFAGFNCVLTARAIITVQVYSFVPACGTIKHIPKWFELFWYVLQERFFVFYM